MAFKANSAVYYGKCLFDMYRKGANQFHVNVRSLHLNRCSFIPKEKRHSKLLLGNTRNTDYAISMKLYSSCYCKFSNSSTKNKVSYEQRRWIQSSTFHLANQSKETVNTTVLTKRQKKKKVKKKIEGDVKNVVAFATAEEYDFDGLLRVLQLQGEYAISKLPDDLVDVIHVTPVVPVPQHMREIFFFQQGSVVFWDMPTEERSKFLKLLRNQGIGRYEVDLTIDEAENMEFKTVDNQQPAESLKKTLSMILKAQFLSRASNNKQCMYNQLRKIINLVTRAGHLHSLPVMARNEEANLSEGIIQVRGQVNEDQVHQGMLEKYTFSHALSQSVKLAVWESQLDNFADSIEHILDDLKGGHRVAIKSQDIVKKLGSLFEFRLNVNLRSDLLDTPDFYWDREDLEALYSKMFQFLNISKRTKVMNEKLSDCIDLMQLIHSNKNDEKHVRLEWIIIILIMIEVFFEIRYFIERYYTEREEVRRRRHDEVK